MDGVRYMRLDLRAPIEGTKVDAGTFFTAPVDIERFARFELGTAQARKIDASAELFLGTPLQAASVGEVAERVEVPPGMYWFTQMKCAGTKIDRAVADELALEQHKEGLWQKVVLGTTIWVRLLPEGSETVVQILRSMA